VFPGPPSGSGPGVPYPASPHPDLGLLPGPGFPHSRDQLPEGPGSWPSVPLPGSRPTRTPYEEAMEALARGNRLAQPDNPTFGIDWGKVPDLIKLKEAYPDVPIGNSPYPGQGFPGVTPPPSYDPDITATTVGALDFKDVGTPVAKLADEILRSMEQARLTENLQRMGANLVPSTLKPLLGMEIPPPNTGGYPTMPGGGPMPYAPSLPISGGNLSPGMPGSNTSTQPMPDMGRKLPDWVTFPPGKPLPQTGPYPPPTQTLPRLP